MEQILRHGTAFDFADLRQIAVSVENKFLDGGVQIHPESELGRIIRAAKLVGTESAKPHDVSVDMRAYHDAHSLARLAQSIVPLETRLLPKRRLRSLYDGDLNFWSSIRSLAKDTEWECHVAAILRAGEAEVSFVEPPDLSFSAVGRSIGIACKKIYSVANAQKQISKGVKQIVKSGMPGILALSLDCFAVREEGAHSYVPDGDLSSAEAIASQVLADIERKFKINRMIENTKIYGTILYAQFYVQNRERPHLFMDVSAIRLTHRGASDEAKRVVDRLDSCLQAYMGNTHGPARIIPSSGSLGKSVNYSAGSEQIPSTNDN